MRKKDCVIFCTCLFMILCFMPLKTEAASNKTKITKTINTFYKAAKTYNVGKMKNCFVRKSDLKAFVEMKEMANYCKKQNKNLKYEIKSIKINGKNATAKVKCKYMSAYNAIYNSFSDTITYMILYDPNLSGRAINIKTYQFFKKNLRYSPAVKKTRIVKFKLVKKGKAWKIEKGSRAIIDTLSCDYESAYQNYFSQFD